MHVKYLLLFKKKEVKLEWSELKGFKSEKFERKAFLAKDLLNGLFQSKKLAIEVELCGKALRG